MNLIANCSLLQSQNSDCIKQYCVHHIASAYTTDGLLCMRQSPNPKEFSGALRNVVEFELHVNTHGSYAMIPILNPTTSRYHYDLQNILR